MKFKTKGESLAQLILTDGERCKLTIDSYRAPPNNDGDYRFVLLTEDAGHMTTLGLTHKKALKLALAILKELAQ